MIERPTYSQHKFYRGIVLKAFADYQNQENAEHVTRNDCHRFLAARFLACEPDPITGMATVEDAARSTASLTRREFSNYIHDCIHFLADFGIQISEPHAKGVA